MEEIKLSESALELMKKIANEVWEKYRDSSGDYYTEKVTRNNQTSTKHPDNVWFFWNQFDGTNQKEFFNRVVEAENSDERIELIAWMTSVGVTGI